MPVPRFEELRIKGPRQSAVRRYIRREWCFVRVLGRRFGVRLLLLVAVMVGGGMLFRSLEPDARYTLPQAVYTAFSLVFGESPEVFPHHIVSIVLLFVIPALGLTVIVEGLIELSLLLRDRRRCERSWCIMLARTYKNHIILVGFGRLGFNTWKLLRKLGEEVVVIERDADNEFLEEVRRDGTALIIGDARRESLLEEANVRQARSLVLATHDDLANLEAALDARRLSPEIHVVLRMFDQNMANKVGEGFDISLAMSQSAISAPAFATAALEPSIVNGFVVADRLVVMRTLDVDARNSLLGLTVAEILSQRQISVVRIESRSGEATDLFPGPATVVHDGDRLTIQGGFKQIVGVFGPS